MEQKIDLRAASPEIIDAILVLAEAVSKLKEGKEMKELKGNMSKEKSSSAEEVEKQGQDIGEVSFDMLRTRCIELARKGKREHVRALLDRYGVKLLTELPKEKYSEVYLEVEKC